MVSKPQGAKPGDPHYRAFVGPPEHFDVMAALQLGLLFALGLREGHRVCDVGCGSLRAGRLLMAYLDPGKYFGIDPEKWVVDEGIDQEVGREFIAIRRPTFRYEADFSLDGFDTEFDFVLAQSVFSHTFADAASQLFSQTAATCPGLLLGTMYEQSESTAHLPDPRSSDGWSYPGNVAYEWDDFAGMAAVAGLEIQRLDWPHPRQQWFVGCRAGAASDVFAEVHRRVGVGYPQLSFDRE